MKQKIAFFDIDGTLTSEIDGSIPESAKIAIKQARDNGHLMFLNTGRCMQNVEKRFQEIGFDGFICGCGTNIYCLVNQKMEELLHVEQSHEIVQKILDHSRKFKLDILFEAKHNVCYDPARELLSEDGIRQYNSFANRNYDLTTDPADPAFVCDKFVVWFTDMNDISEFCKVSDQYFECIDRGGNFREFVPLGYSKATGIQAVLDHYGLDIEDTYAFGDSNNDLAMLSYVKNSIAMGNADPVSLFDVVTYKTTNASQDGIKNGLHHFGFI